MLKNDLEFFRIIYRFFADADRLTWASIGITVIVGFLYFRAFFPRRDGFNDIPRDYTRGPDFRWAEWKIIAFIALSAGTGMLSYHQLPHWFPHAFNR
jgi:hypothetical protein